LAVSERVDIYIEQSLYLLQHRVREFVKGWERNFWSPALPEMRQKGKSQHPSAFGSGIKCQIKIKEAIAVR